MAKEGKTAVVPRLRFPEYRNSEEWKRKPLSAVLDYERPEKYIVSDTAYQASGVPVLTANKSFVLGYTHETTGIFTDTPVVIFDDFTTDKKYVDFPFKVKSSAIKILRVKGDDSLKLIFELMGSIKFDPKEHKRYYISEYQNLEIALPNGAEQQKIADCLSSLDELIAAQGRKVEALKTYKRGLMQQLFPREGETLPRLRFPEFASTGSWHTQKIASLLSKASISANVEPDQMYREIGIRSHGKGIFHKEPTLGKVIGEKRVFQVVQDALVLNIVFAWEQAVATTTKNEIGMIASHRFPMYVAKPGKCDVEYVKGFFLTKEGKRLLGVASPGGAGRNKTLGQKEFENLEIALPVSVDEQTRIANCLSSLDTKITIESDKLESLKAHKQGLMQQLFPSLEEA